jgi:S-ribosylhomocysteine lyase
MERIASFSVDHDRLEKGMYISRIDGDIITYDIRMKRPNQGDYIPNGALHTIEHLFATYARNSSFSDSIIYVGPMGCRTGFYLVTRDDMSGEDAIGLVKDSLEFISGFEGEIPGAKRKECGNYLEHDLEGAREVARDMIGVLKDWNEGRLSYDYGQEG